MMNKRNSSGGGQSSLGYLFGSDEVQQQQHDQSKISSPPVLTPPYGTDHEDMKPPETAPSPPATKKDHDTTSPNNYVYHGDGDKSKHFLVTVSFCLLSLIIHTFSSSLLI